MSVKQCRPQYGGPVLEAGRELSGKIHKVNDTFNSLASQVVSNMHDIKGLLDRIKELEDNLNKHKDNYVINDLPELLAFDNRLAERLDKLEKKLNKQ